MDFFIGRRTLKEDLEAQEQRNMYPPRFQIFLVSSPDDVSLSGSRIRFKGADCDLQYDIHLDPPEISKLPYSIM